MTHSKTPNRRAIVFALAALTATVPAAVHAGEEAYTVRVPYGDLDLTSAAGLETLDRRLDRAVKRVCGEADQRSLRSGNQVAKCRQLTRANIVPQRQFAIAKATAPTDREWAENARNPQVVRVAE